MLPINSMPPLKECQASIYFFIHGVAPNRVYINNMSPYYLVSSYLAFPSLPDKIRRYISVALSLGLPPAVVNRYSRFTEPGLSSQISFSTLSRDYKICYRYKYNIFNKTMSIRTHKKLYIEIFLFQVYSRSDLE